MYLQLREIKDILYQYQTRQALKQKKGTLVCFKLEGLTWGNTSQGLHWNNCSNLSSKKGQLIFKGRNFLECCLINTDFLCTVFWNALHWIQMWIWIRRSRTFLFSPQFSPTKQKKDSFKRLSQQWKPQNYLGCSSKLLSLSKTWKETTLLTTHNLWNVLSLPLLKYNEDPCKVIVRISQIIHSDSQTSQSHTVRLSLFNNY